MIVRTQADDRLEAVAAVNAALANLNTAEERVQKARSELGTANAELGRKTAEYARQARRLLSTMPDLITEVVAHRDRLATLAIESERLVVAGARVAGTPPDSALGEHEAAMPPPVTSDDGAP